MLKLIQKNWSHCIIWTAMLVYMVTSPSVHTRYILKDGKPVSFNEEITKKSKQIAYSVDRFDPVLLRGQNLYHLWGWAYVRGDPNPLAYERLIVLHSDKNVYYFPSVTNARPDVQAQFPDLDLSVDVGFSAHISKDTLPRGIYRIGFVFNHRENHSTYYLLTDRKIIRTPNNLQLLPP